MDYIVPIGVVIYLIASVVGAVIKAMGNQKPILNEPMDPAAAGVEPVEEPEVVFPQEPTQQEVEAIEIAPEQDAQAQTFDEQVEEVENAELEDGGWSPPPQQKAADGVTVTTISKRQLIRGIVMSEIIREPRSKRPWPNR